MNELKIEKELKKEAIKKFEIYGKTFEIKESALNWKRSIERDLNASWFIVESNLHNEGKFIVKVYDYLGENGLIFKLNKMNIPLLTITPFSDGKYVKGFSFTKVGRFKCWESMQKFSEENSNLSVIVVNSLDLKKTI